MDPITTAAAAGWNSAIVSAIISGVSGVGGAFLGAWMTTRNARKKSASDELKSAQYLATLVAPALNKLAASCIRISHDDGYYEGRPAAENGECESTTSLSDFKASEFEVDWKSLPGDLMHEVLRFSEKRDAVHAELDDWHGYHDPPYHSKYFKDRQYHHTKLGIAASDLSARLLAAAHLAADPVGPATITGTLRSRLLELEVERAKAKVRREQFDRKYAEEIAPHLASLSTSLGQTSNSGLEVPSPASSTAKSEIKS